MLWRRPIRTKLLKAAKPQTVVDLVIRRVAGNEVIRFIKCESIIPEHARYKDPTARDL